MPYYVTVPQANQRISASQPQIQANFAALEQIVGVDHGTFTAAAADWGKHNKVSFLLQGAAPVFAAGEYGMYNIAAGLFLHPPVGIDRNIGVYTLYSNATIPPVPAGTTQGTSTLPSGLIIKWGQVPTAPPAGQYTLTFAVPFPAQCISVVATVSDNHGAPFTYYYNVINTYNNIRFLLDRINMGTGAVTNNGFQWIAIGY